MAKAIKDQSLSGMKDILGKDWQYFEKAQKIAEKAADFFGFDKIETPILERSEIFEKGTGQNTDIVEKEMYTFRSKGGEYLTLRPEMTPGVVRAYIQHGMQNMPKPVKLWYCGPCFRHERPQAGRYRQFNQIGFESFGVDSPVIDAVLIQVFYNILKDLGFDNLLININCIGDAQCRPGYKRALLAYFRQRQSSLCAVCRNRLKKNPLRILDCKEEKCQKVCSTAPQMVDYLCKECHDFFKNLLELLDELNLPYRLNSCLVRGLDYYSKTVFEIVQETPEGETQGSLAGGGRYDGLVKVLGGKNTPACGGALGVERVVNLLRQEEKEEKKSEEQEIEKEVDVFLAQVGELARRKTFKFFNSLRKSGIKIGESLHKDSLSAQLKIADKMKAKYCLIMGQKEALDDNILVRETKSGSQRQIPLSEALGHIKQKLKS